MIPTPDTNIVAEGQGLTTSHYATAPVVQGIIQSLMQRLQEIENSFWAFINDIQLANHPLPGGPWSVLDQIGAIVGGLAANRNGLSDADYLALIKLQARVNRSRGLAEDVIQLAMTMNGGVAPVYVEGSSFWTAQGLPISGWQATFYLGCWDLALNYAQFVACLKQIRPAGVYGHFHYTTWPTGSDLVLGSRYGGATTQGVVGSRYGGVANGGKLAAGVAL